MSELKKCPFCGGEVKLHISELNVYCFICDDCEMEITYPYSNEEKAITAWSTRIPVDDVVEALEEQAEGNKKLWDELDAEDAFGGMNAYMRAISIVKEHLT